MGTFADLEKKIKEKKKKLEDLKADLKTDQALLSKCNSVVLWLDDCLEQATKGKKSEDAFDNAVKAFDKSYEMYKKDKNALKTALKSSPLKEAVKLLDAGDQAVASAAAATSASAPSSA